MKSWQLFLLMTAIYVAPQVGRAGVVLAVVCLAISVYFAFTEGRE